MFHKIFINRNFFLLWLGKIISLLGDKFYSLALAWWVLQKTGSPGIMGFFMLASALPGFIIGFFAGAVVDRLNRKKILIIADLVRGFLIMILVILSEFNQLQVWQVFITGILISLTTAFFEPAIQSVIPQAVEREKLNRANSLNQFANGFCTIAGPILGATVTGFLGISFAFLLNGISYSISAILELMFTYNPSIKASEYRNNIFQDMKEGILFLKGKTEVVRVIVIIAVTHFFMGSILVLLPFLAQSVNGSGVRNLGYLETFMGVGLLVGSIIIGRSNKYVATEQRLISVIMFIGFFYMLIGIGQFIALKSPLPYLAVLFMIGGGVAFASIFWQSILQLNVPAEMTGRVFSLSSVAGNTSLPLSFGLFGLLLSYSSIKVLMLVCGFSLLLFSIALFLLQTGNRSQIVNS